MDSKIRLSSKKILLIFWADYINLYIDNCHFIILTVPTLNQEISFHLFTPLLGLCVVNNSSFYKSCTFLCKYIPRCFIFLIFILFFAIFNINEIFFFPYSLQVALVHVLERKQFLHCFLTVQ